MSHPDCKPDRHVSIEGGNLHYSFRAILGMELEGGNEDRQKVLAYLSALQAEFVVGRFRYLPRVKFQQAGRINIH